jgi:hypothetical protein
MAHRRGLASLVWRRALGRQRNDPFTSDPAITDESPIAFIPAADPDPMRGEAFLSFYADPAPPHGYVVPIHDQQSANDP